MTMANIRYKGANGRVYDWASTNISMLGRNVVGVTSISYGSNYPIEAIYGAGQELIGMGHGNIETTGSITLKQDEIQELINIAPLGIIQDIPKFDIKVSFLATPSKFVTHTLKGVKFMNAPTSLGQGDTSYDVEVELFISWIDYGTTPV